MKKYTTPVLTQYNVATEGMMLTLSTIPTSGSGKQSSGGAQTFEKQFSIWGDDYSDGQADDLDFNSTGIF